MDIAPPGAGTDHTPNTAPPPVRLPPPTRLAFDVSGQAKKFAYSARAELLWQHDGSRYEARQEISAFLVGTRAQRSVGAITAQGLLPERFSDRSRSEQAAHFDYTKGRVTFSANTPDATVGPGVQDRLSVFIQLGALLAADPARFVTGTQITLTTVSARSADRWTFTIEGPETLDLPTGATPALKLQRLPRKDYDQKAELWVAPALGYLPVRIKLTQANGDFADLLLRASGHEPDWSIAVSNQGLVLHRPGQEPQALPYLEEQLPEGRLNLSSEANGQRLELWVAKQRCVDSMSGTVQHLSAELRLNGQVLRGCGYLGGARND